MDIEFFKAGKNNILCKLMCLKVYEGLVFCLQPGFRGSDLFLPPILSDFQVIVWVPGGRDAVCLISRVSTTASIHYRHIKLYCLSIYHWLARLCSWIYRPGSRPTDHCWIQIKSRTAGMERKITLEWIIFISFNFTQKDLLQRQVVEIRCHVGDCFQYWWTSHTRRLWKDAHVFFNIHAVKYLCEFHTLPLDHLAKQWEGKKTHSHIMLFSRESAATSHPLHPSQILHQVFNVASPPQEDTSLNLHYLF